MPDNPKPLWAVSFTQEDGTIHVYPLFGGEHHFPEPCFCQPTQDRQEERLWIHHPMQ